MNKRQYYYPLAIIAIGMFLGLLGWFNESSSIRWIAPAFGLVLIGVALGLSSLIIASNTEKRATELIAGLARIESLAEELREEISGKKNHGAQIIPTLEAISQYYTEYLNRPKGEEKQ